MLTKKFLPNKNEITPMQLIRERAFWQLLPTERSTISFSVDGLNGCTSEKKNKIKSRGPHVKQETKRILNCKYFIVYSTFLIFRLLLLLSQWQILLQPLMFHYYSKTKYLNNHTLYSDLGTFLYAWLRKGSTSRKSVTASQLKTNQLHCCDELSPP